MIMRIFISLLAGAAGFVLLLKTREVVDFTGTNSWIERFFGSGQTYAFIKILGIIVIFGSFLYLIGDLDKVFGFIVKIFIPGGK